ncbi:hypothetical protein Vadar_022840 [Vaccinium darrowii]|uniref:Uncharacterized protein n=1 Tax=Vaccinium darrowii TaxID=229202 RepID=A0ACB7YQ34_9ERIC|nr:hypothetical protein Vadar_022840 [Vaccinium darrowii]
MAEKIVFDIAAKLLSSLGSIAIQQIGSEWGVEEELQKLQVTVSTIKNVLLDAQEKQKSDNLVKDWLQELKEILYDADDLLDEVATETKRRELETRNKLVRKVRYFLTSSNPLVFQHKVGSKIKGIVKRLNHIASLIDQFKFFVNQVERPIATIRREETFSWVNTRRIIGRRDDIDEFITSLSSGYQADVVIIPIVGIAEGEEEMHENLVNIGNEIVNNCGGVPLTVVTLGSLLASKTEEGYWLSVRDNEMWALAQRENKNDILPVLRLSYDEMPSNLKQCFAYCSLFERDEIIDGKKLLYAWIAQGFVQGDGNGELEDIGERYIQELVSRFFLEPYDARTFSNTTGREHYKMHGLVHSLAQDVAGNECLTIKRAITDAVPKMLRHVAFASETYSEFPRPLMEAKKLRTIFYPGKRNPTFGSSIETESTSFRSLRVCAFEDMISSPKKIRKLKLLRYLSLTEVDNLPKSLCKLLNLQYLDLYLSGDLELPKDFEKLINLRFLCLSTTSERLPKKGIGMLTSLRTLIIFHCEALRSLEGIKHLSCLRELALESCLKLPSLPDGLNFLTSLERLEISSCLFLNLSDDDLKGLERLKQLKLRNLQCLVSLPKGLLAADGKLTHLEIEWCTYFTSPSESVLPNLKSLESLKIWNCEKVGSLPEGMQGLRRLQSVSIVGCPLFITTYEGQEAERQKIAHVRKIELS